MNKRQMVHTYGRHRQRVVSMDVWSSPSNSVFSSSNDSLLICNSSSSGSTGHSSRGSNEKKNAGNLSWLPNDENTRPKNRSQYTRNAKKYLEDSCENLKPDKSVNNKKKRPVLREKTNIKTDEFVNKSGKKINSRTNRKTRNTTRQHTTQLKDPSTHKTSGSKTELSHNFSDFEAYDLVLESPQAERVSPEVSELPGDQSVEGVGGLASTPHMEMTGSDQRILRSHRKRSALTSTPHVQTSFAQNKFFSNVSVRPYARQPSQPASVSAHQTSFSDLQPPPEGNESTQELDHLHLSGMSSIAGSPAVSSGQPQGSVGTPAYSNQAEALKQCTVSLQKLRTLTCSHDTSQDQRYRGHMTGLTNGESPVQSDQLSFTQSGWMARSTSKMGVPPAQLPGGKEEVSLQYSLLHSAMDYSHDKASTASHQHSQDAFYSCSSSKLSAKPLTSINAKNSTYTVEGGSYSYDASRDLFDSPSQASSPRCPEGKRRKAAASGLDSIQEVSQRLKRMSIHKGPTEPDQSINDSVSLYSLASDEEELSDLEEAEEGQDQGGGDSLYTLASGDEELSVIAEEEEASPANPLDHIIKGSHLHRLDRQPPKQGDKESESRHNGDSESETDQSESETEESESEHIQTNNESSQNETHESETEVIEISESESEEISLASEDDERDVGASYSDEDSVYLTASQSQTSIPGLVTMSSHVVNSVSDKTKTSFASSYHTPSKQNTSSLQPKQVHQCCVSLKALTPVRCRKSGQTLSARDKVLLKCNQMEPVGFNQAITPGMLKKCVKIGEGVYGEVFKTDRNRQSVALKIIPIEGDFEVNDEPQKTFEEMLPEIVISKEGFHFRQIKADLEKSEFQGESLQGNLDMYTAAKDKVIDGVLLSLEKRYADVDSGILAASKLASKTNWPANYDAGFGDALVLCAVDHFKNTLLRAEADPARIEHEWDTLKRVLYKKELCALKDTEENMTPNFVEVKRVTVVQGCYPPQLLRQWDAFNKRKGSENDRPDMFDDDQLFIVFEFEECGCDLEGFKFERLEQAKSVLLQVTCAFTVAEAALQFEHRDLHWGNVLVKGTREETLTYRLGGETFQVETCGLKVAIIDFTLSRLSKDGCEVFCDLSSDPTLFTGQGDHQFEVYRLMKEENGNDWRGFHPYTNVLWIHYLADKLLRGKSYSNISSREHKLMCRQFRTFIRDALDYQSALHLLKQNSFFSES